MSNINTVASGALWSQTNPTAESAFPSASGGATRTIATAANVCMFDGRPFMVNVGLRITGGTTTNFTPALRFDSNANTNLTTFTGDTALTAITAFAVNSITTNWMLRALLLWDSISQKLNGHFCTQQGATFNAWAALSNIPITITSHNLLRFLVTGFFSATSGTNLCVLTNFTIDQL